MTAPAARGLTIVTGASQDHAASLQNLLRSLAWSRVDARVVVYDLGLGMEDRRAIATACDEVRRFPFERYPDWMDIGRPGRGEYAWKPIIVAEMIDDTQAPVLWLDAGDLVFGNLERVRAVLATEGFYSPRSAGVVAEWTHPGTLRFLGADGDLLARRNRNGAVVGFDPGRAGMATLVRTWRKCAETRDCIAPPGSSRENHRQDQAVLTVLAYQFQRAFGFALVDRRLDIKIRRDGLAPAALEHELRALRARAVWFHRRLDVQRAWHMLKRETAVAPTPARGMRVLVDGGGRLLQAALGGGPPRPARPRSGGVARRDGPFRVALVAYGALPIPPQGWGATERGIWNHQKHHAAHGIASAIVNDARADRIVAELEAIAPDVVHLHAEAHLAAVLRYTRTRPTPIVLTSHDGMIMRRLSPNLVRALRHVTATIALSLGIKQRLELAGFGGPIVAIPNGVDTGRFVPRAKTPNTVLAVGKNVRRKRLSDIASFFLSRPDYHLTICGPGADTDLPGRRIPRGPNVHVLGNQSEEAIAARLGASEYFVHLAEQEGSALAVREAMAAGCKVWTTPSNAQDLAHVAVHWEAAVRDHGLGERARHEAVTTFDWQAIVRRTVEVYREAIARFERRPR